MAVPCLYEALLVLLALIHTSSPARILGVFPHVGKSHFDAFQPLLEALASRGHDVVVVGHFPRTVPLANYTDVSLAGSVQQLNSISAVDVSRVEHLAGWQLSAGLSVFGARTCEQVLGHPAVSNLLGTAHSFDLVLTEVFNTDCFLGFARRFNAPHIALSSHLLMPWVAPRVGNPDEPAYVRQLFSTARADMSFTERLENAWWLLYHRTVYSLVECWSVNGLVREHFGEGTSLEELRRNTSLVLVNTHFSVSGARPLVPGVIEVGGMHIRSPEALPQELEEFVSGAEHGVVYFSMGSMIRGETLPPDKVQAFMQAFAELPQRVLWKWGGKKDPPARPANVRTVNWLPQLALLEHAKTRAYISHCGNLGTLEAVQAGVPIVAVPMYGDQPNNARSLEERGMAVVLSYHHITKDTLLSALKAVLEDPRFADNARKVSLAFKDRPQPPLDAAVYWTEYVLRHRGAPLLRTAGADMPWYRRLMLDALGLLAVLITAVGVCLRRLLRPAFHCKSKTE